MKTLKILCIVLIFTMSGFSSLFAQGFKPPTEGKAVIYFVSVKKTTNYEYFHQDKYIGVFKGKNHMRVECDPGEDLYWVSAENKYFITTNLMKGGTYIVVVSTKMGMWSAGVRAIPITEKHELFEKACALINKQAPVIIPESLVEKRNSELVDFIANIMDHYNNEWKDKKDYPHISTDMAIPPSALK